MKNILYVYILLFGASMIMMGLRLQAIEIAIYETRTIEKPTYKHNLTIIEKEKVWKI